MQNKDVQAANFDYMGWWKHCVKTLQISPSEAWALDYTEIATLSDIEPRHQQDGSHMVNAQRRMNGMKQGDIKNGN